MKFIISKLHLTVALNNVSRAVSSRNPNPVLTGLKFELNKNGLFITGSDSDLSIVTKIPLEENEEKIIDAFSFGTAVLSSKLITEIIRKLDSQNER
ncbi:MAG: DNA polymerase III subunit beta, partial [Erysipelotrichales bacterium]|nr:DNA polymerase III subunit beta [Erysipelotrichales bacterium]